MELKTIIFPTDFSACAQNALDYAAGLAEKMQSRLVVVHVSPEFQVGGIDQAASRQYFEERLGGARAGLAKVHDEIRDRLPLLDLQIYLLEGPEVLTLLNLAERENADIIILGTQGASGIQELLLGSFAASVVEKAKCPVLAVPSKASYKGFSKIAYASDLNEKDPKVIKQTTDLAKLFSSEITILNISEGDRISEEQLYNFEKEVRENAEYPKLDFIYFKGTEVNKHIQEYSERNAVDLIVMTMMEKSLLKKLVIGSHTKRMAYHSRIPLLVFHEKDNILT